MLAPNNTNPFSLCTLLIALSLTLLSGCSNTRPRTEVVVKAPATSADSSATNNLWQILRQGLVLTDLNSPAVTRELTQIKSQHPERLLEKASPYLHLIMQEAQIRHMPMEVILLPIIESGFNPHAKSPVGAEGPWQFMSATAQEQGLAINRVLDERKSWQNATRKALDYLQQQYAHFGDWPLAFAAYNAGQGRVDQALQHGQHFDALKLPKETRDYVHKIFAWKQLLQNAEQHGLQLPTITPQLIEVPVEQDLDIDLASQLAGLPEAHLRQLNPAFKGPMIPAASRSALLLPKASATAFKLNLHNARNQGSLSQWQLSRLPQATSAQQLANDLNLNPTQISRLNPVAHGHRYKAGSVLWLPKNCPLPAAQSWEIQHAHLHTERITPLAKRLPRPVTQITLNYRKTPSHRG